MTRRSPKVKRSNSDNGVASPPSLPVAKSGVEDFSAAVKASQPISPPPHNSISIQNFTVNFNLNLRHSDIDAGKLTGADLAALIKSDNEVELADIKADSEKCVKREETRQQEIGVQRYYAQNQRVRQVLAAVFATAILLIAIFSPATPVKVVSVLITGAVLCVGFGGTFTAKRGDVEVSATGQRRAELEEKPHNSAAKQEESLPEKREIH